MFHSNTDSERMEFENGAWVEVRAMSVSQFFSWQQAGRRDIASGMRACLNYGLAAIGGFTDRDGNAVDLEGKKAATYLFENTNPALVDTIAAVIIERSGLPEDEKKILESFSMRHSKSAASALDPV